MNKNDLANGYYNHLPKVSESDITMMALWLHSKGAPSQWRLYAPKATSSFGDSPNPDRLMPTEIEWTKDGKTHSLDAALVYHFPHVALTELKIQFGFGNPNVLEYYTGPRKDLAIVEQSPIGSAWPDKGFDAYRSVGAEDTHAYGMIYSDASGSYRKERHGWAFLAYPIWRKVA